MGSRGSKKRKNKDVTPELFLWFSKLSPKDKELLKQYCNKSVEKDLNIYICVQLQMYLGHMYMKIV